MSEDNISKVNTSRLILLEDIAKIESLNNIQVKYVVSIRGGPSIYNLMDLDDKKNMGLIMLGRSDYYPGSDDFLYQRNELQKKLGEMLQTPKVQLKKLVESDEILCKDMEEVTALLGVDFYKPRGLPLEKRILNKQKQILNVTSELYSKNMYTSSVQIGVIEVRISEYIPGRYEYSNDAIYQHGELEQVFKQDSKLFLTYAKNVLYNQQYVELYNSGKKVQWDIRVTNLKRDFPELFN